MTFLTFEMLPIIKLLMGVTFRELDVLRKIDVSVSGFGTCLEAL